jgi:hypothetical protein
LEAVLLVGVEQELSYRFALNYATLFASPADRFAAFEKARRVYKIRSKISHGVDVSQDRVRDAAADAREMLRTVVRNFLPDGRRPRYRTEGYWDRALFGVT